MKRLLLIAASFLTTPVLVLGIQATAQANYGTVDNMEYWAMNEGIPKATYENTWCLCSGHKIRSWTGDKYGNDDPSGYKYKVVSYSVPSGFPNTYNRNTVEVRAQYRYWNGGWHLNWRHGQCNVDACRWDYY